MQHSHTAYSSVVCTEREMADIGHGSESPMPSSKRLKINRNRYHDSAPPRGLAKALGSLGDRAHAGSGRKD